MLECLNNFLTCRCKHIQSKPKVNTVEYYFVILSMHFITRGIYIERMPKYCKVRVWQVSNQKKRQIKANKMPQIRPQKDLR